MKSAITIIVVFAWFCNKTYSQVEWSANGHYRVFRSIKEAGSVNPDSVLYLDLGNNGLKKFPVEILKFKNLLVLDFTNKDNSYYFYKRPDMLTKQEKRHVEAGKNTKYSRDLDKTSPIKNRNRFKKIPKEIAQLTKLEELAIGKTNYINCDAFKSPAIYTSIEQTQKVNPDSVRYLDLSNSGLKKFPVEIFKFKNLEMLQLDNRRNYYYFEIMSIAGGKNYWILKNKKNRIREIPEEIATLRNLRTLIIPGNTGMKKQLEKLKEYLPQCVVEW